MFYKIFIFFCFFWVSLSTNASQIAIIKSDKAYIYSDQDQTSILGWVKKGKKIMVGDVPRSASTLLPTVVSGKIGYIQISDIELKNPSTLKKK